MDIKDTLGEELFNQVVEKIGKDKDLVISNTGDWIPRGKLDAANQENEQLKEQISNTNTQLETLKVKAAGNEEYLNQIAELEQTKKDLEEQHKVELEQINRNVAITTALNSPDYKIIDTEIVKSLLDDEVIKVEDGKVTGLEEQIAALQESKSFLFTEEKKKIFSGFEPKGDGKKQGQNNLSVGEQLAASRNEDNNTNNDPWGQ